MEVWIALCEKPQLHFVQAAQSKFAVHSKGALLSEKCPRQAPKTPKWSWHRLCSLHHVGGSANDLAYKKY